jgi:hypothetical protein
VLPVLDCFEVRVLLAVDGDVCVSLRVEADAHTVWAALQGAWGEPRMFHAGEADLLLPLTVRGTSTRTEPVVAVTVPLAAFGPASRRKTNVTEAPGGSCCVAVQVTVPVPAGQPIDPAGGLPGPTTLTPPGSVSVNVIGAAGAEPVLWMVIGKSVGGPPVDIVNPLGADATSEGAVAAAVVVVAADAVALDWPVVTGVVAPVEVGADEPPGSGVVGVPAMLLDAGGAAAVAGATAGGRGPSVPIPTATAITRTEAAAPSSAGVVAADADALALAVAAR